MKFFIPSFHYFDAILSVGPSTAIIGVRAPRSNSISHSAKACGVPVFKRFVCGDAVLSDEDVTTSPSRSASPPWALVGNSRDQMTETDDRTEIVVIIDAANVMRHTSLRDPAYAGERKAAYEAARERESVHGRVALASGLIGMLQHCIGVPTSPHSMVPATAPSRSRCGAGRQRSNPAWTRWWR